MFACLCTLYDTFPQTVYDLWDNLMLGGKGPGARIYILTFRAAYHV